MAEEKAKKSHPLASLSAGWRIVALLLVFSLVCLGAWGEWWVFVWSWRLGAFWSTFTVALIAVIDLTFISWTKIPA